MSSATHKKIEPQYVFRGTTLGYPGNYSSYTPPGCTHTTINPIKAALFAIHCPRIFMMPKVILIADTADLKGIKRLHGNFFFKEEEEINWEIPPLEFHKKCRGYITLDELKNALLTIEKPLTEEWAFEHLTQQLKNQDSISHDQLGRLFDAINGLIKKP